MIFRPVPDDRLEPIRPTPYGGDVAVHLRDDDLAALETEQLLHDSIGNVLWRQHELLGRSERVGPGLDERRLDVGWMNRGGDDVRCGITVLEFEVET